MRDAPLTTLLGCWLDERLARRRPRGPFVVGINGPQGSGKSTLVAQLVARFRGAGLSAAGVSVDDFYLTHARQSALAAANPGNPFLEHRGYPGTHDVPFGAAVLDALSSSEAIGVAVPAYDKSAHGGRGDREAPDRWPQVSTPLDVLFVEGWLLGFQAVPEIELPDDRLRGPNAALVAYAAWERHLNAFVQLVALLPAHIVAWRVDAERARRNSGAPALSDAEARDYITRFLPAYALWGPPLRSRLDLPGATMGDVLRVELSADRTPLRVVPG